jgi:hypothetical protein
MAAHLTKIADQAVPLIASASASHARHRDSLSRRAVVAVVCHSAAALRTTDIVSEADRADPLQYDGGRERHRM